MATQEAALDDAAYVSVPQGEQTRSVDAVPSMATNVPGTQVVNATQSVEAS